MTTRCSLALSCLLLAASAARAQVDVAGTYSDDPSSPGSPTVWGGAETLYRVVGDVVAANLRILPGTTIEFTGAYQLTVTGVLDAVGTAGAPIVFQRETGAPRWRRILFDRSSPACRFVHCRVSGAGESGIHVVDAAPEIASCVITDCVAVQDGGGLRIDFLGAGSPVEIALEGCQIIACKAPGNGGGVAAVTAGGERVIFRDCRIAGCVANPADAGGAFVGGGLWLSGSAGFTLERCVVEGNTVYSQCSSKGCDIEGRGGGLFLDTTAGSSLIGCRITGNEAHVTGRGDDWTGNRAYTWARGAGCYIDAGEVSVENSVIDHNKAFVAAGARAAHEGGGIYLNSGQLHVRNCTIAYNSYGDARAIWRAGGTVDVTASILWGDGSGELAGLPSPPDPGVFSVTWSCVQNMTEDPERHVINRNPNFASESDLRIVPVSPCIDAGPDDPAWNDCAGSAALGGPRNDVGAHGGPGGCDAPVEPDCDGDGISDADALAAGRARDLNRNGVPDPCDIASGASADLDGDGIPDEVERASVRLEPAAVPGRVAYDVVLSSGEPARDGDTGQPIVDPFVRGDADASGALQITDAIRILEGIFGPAASGDPAPALPCLDAADADDSGRLDITDAVLVLRHLFLGGPPPPEPFPRCGTDPSVDPLGCEEGFRC